ncbi:MAG: AI-2E family transporter [Chloroflexi bacterium]|nr:AI-2E family transporter [Chloroflexota bacterium]MBP8054633.1 AI-2E family transporter [Chloroflexota bacterium]
MTKQLIGIGMAIMTTLLALVLLWQFRTVVVYVLVSLAFAAAVRPFVHYQATQSRVRRLALGALALLVLGAFLSLLFLGIGSAIRDIQELAEQVSNQNAWRQPAWLQGSALQQFLDERLPPPSEIFSALIGEQGQLVLPAILGFTQGIFSLLSAGLIILFLSLYWSVDQIHFERLWLSLLPPGQRQSMRAMWRAIELDVGAYVRSEVGQSILAALLLSLGYWLLGSPYPILLALIGALAWLIPVVGVILAVLAPLLLGLLTGVSLSLLTVLYTLIVLVVLEKWVEPRLANHTHTNPILTLIILMALADVYGVLGMIVAPPLSAACQILWNHLISRRTAAAILVSDLQERQQRVWHTIEAMAEPPRLAVSSLERLTKLLADAEPILNAAAEPEGLLLPESPPPLSHQAGFQEPV